MTWTDVRSDAGAFVVWDSLEGLPISTMWDGVLTDWDDGATDWDDGDTIWGDETTYWR